MWFINIVVFKLLNKHNRVVEEKHRLLLNVACAFCFQANLSLIIWDDCILVAAYLINQMPIKVFQDKISHELLYRRISFYHYLKVFGYLCYEPKPNI